MKNNIHFIAAIFNWSSDVRPGEKNYEVWDAKRVWTIWGHLTVYHERKCNKLSFSLKA